MTNEEKMLVAIEVAKESLKNGELPVGAVIFFRGRYSCKGKFFGRKRK